jgi:hypothetical protein
MNTKGKCGGSDVGHFQTQQGTCAGQTAVAITSLESIGLVVNFFPACWICCFLGCCGNGLCGKSSVMLLTYIIVVAVDLRFVNEAAFCSF